MHLASALGVPTVTVFGATDDTATGPAGAWARIVREQVECAPCLLRECPIDHRCMTGVPAGRVAEAAFELWKESAG
jgi:heptosyltransferase-2